MGSNPLAKLGAWPLRAAWLVLPFATGPALAEALDTTSRPVQVVATTILWSAWVAMLIATLIPTTVSLTAIRVISPAAIAAAAAATGHALQDGESLGIVHVASTATVILVAAIAFHPDTGARFVNGSAYGDEKRLPLRVPAALMLGPVQIAWIAVVAGIVTGPLLLASRQWIPGVIALVLGVPAALWGVRVLHSLARRWTVFVPGGLVLHDHLVLADPVLFRRALLAAVEPAPADTDALDLTAGAAGLAVEARFLRPLPLVTSTNRRRGTTETVETSAVLFTPTQPGAFLTVARNRLLGARTPAPPR